MRREDGSWEVFEDYVLDFAIDCATRGLRYALVTLVGIEGSSPRLLGAQMAVSETGSFVGYLSGGCVERAIVSEALDALFESQDRVVRYGRGSRYFDIQLPCGSGIDLYFDVSQSIDELTAIDSMLADRGASEMEIHVPAGPGRTRQTLVVHYLARRRLLIAGGGPSAVLLCSLGALSGFDVELWSPDEATRNSAKSLQTKIVELSSPRNAYELSADGRTAIVFMFHDHIWEENLVPSALATDAFYIGAMGSKATHGKRREGLLSKGFSIDQIDRIRGPAGVFSGAKSGPDIAISILADVVSAQHQAVDERRRAYVRPHSQLILDQERFVERPLS